MNQTRVSSNLICSRFAFVLALVFSASASALTNRNFEQPPVLDTGFAVLTGTTVGWTFALDGAGVSGKDSAFTSGNPLTGVGQVGYLTDLASMSQSVFLSSGRYVITLLATQRMNTQIGGPQTLNISVGGTSVGTFTPANGDLQPYETEPFTIASAGNYTISLAGAVPDHTGGTTNDSTVFLDNVGIHLAQSIIDPVDIGTTGCNSLTHFYAGFAPANILNISVRQMASNIVSNDSWYNASVNTLLGPDSQVCDKGPYATEAMDPDGSGAQSTFQLKDTEGGFLILSRNATDPSKNPNAAFTEIFSPYVPVFQNAGDTIEISADLRLTMFNPNPVGGQVGQYYVGFNLVDNSTGTILPWSILAYDSRTPLQLGLGVQTCDTFDPDDGTTAHRPFILSTFSNINLYTSAPCPLKVVTIAAGSHTMQTGTGSPPYGAWTDLRSYTVRISAENLLAGIAQINTLRAGLSPPLSPMSTNITDYKMEEAAVLHELIWSGTEQVDSASSFRNFTVRDYVDTMLPAPVFASAVSRKVHGGAGTFDLPVALTPTNPTTEPRQGPTATVVMTFDKPVSGATATIIEGTAAAATPTFSGSSVTISLSGVSDEQYVTVALTNVAGTDGSTGGSGRVRVGFLLGDVNQNRVVSTADVALVNAQLSQPVTSSNYLDDVNASGTLTLADKALANGALTHSLPAP